jgi:hypothetical protein
MAAELPAHIWFVRSNGGSGSYPVRPEGWRAVYMFVGGMAASAVLGIILAMSAPTWLWVVVFVVGMALSAGWFIQTARKHTDYSLTYHEWVAQQPPR